jgi:thiamine pyrophosphokinase
MLKQYPNLRQTAGGFVLQAIVFANGDFVQPPDLAARLAAADLILAADGGSQHCRALGLHPDVIIGDLDSLESGTRAEWESQGVHIISHPPEKDQTDLELAFLHAKDAGAENITVLAALGRRWDHSFANLLLAAHPQFDGCRILFLHGDQRLLVIKGNVTLDAKMGDRVSLLSLAGDAKGVTTRGLKYPLTAETLLFGSSRGVSNVVLTDQPQVELASGTLLCIISSADQE